MSDRETMRALAVETLSGDNASFQVLQDLALEVGGEDAQVLSNKADRVLRDVYGQIEIVQRMAGVDSVRISPDVVEIRDVVRAGNVDPDWQGIVLRLLPRSRNTYLTSSKVVYVGDDLEGIGFDLRFMLNSDLDEETVDAVGNANQLATAEEVGQAQRAQADILAAVALVRRTLNDHERGLGLFPGSLARIARDRLNKACG